MLLRPATPLSIILIIAFVLLLLSTLSTPIIKAIPLAVDQGWAFGVFGYCSTSGTNCISPHIGYSTDQLPNGSSSDDFSLPSTSRHSLSYILIIHPIAALLTLICAILAVSAHFHAPASSARFLLALLILTIPTLLASLLAFLVDILLFVPRMAWGGWIVLAATILIVASSVLTCAMRRTLISRKARTKRIAENEDMNGATYYNTLNEHRMMTDQLPRADSPPPMPSYGADKAGAQYASFEMKSHNSTGRTSDDRTPLDPTRAASVRSASTGAGARRPYGDEQPPLPNSMSNPYFQEGRGISPRRPSRDDYGSPISPTSPNEMGGPVLRHSGSRGSLNSNGSNRGMPYGRGRGYGPPQQRGGYGPARAAYGPQRGRGYGPRGGAYRGGPPSPGYNGRGGYGPRGGYGAQAMQPRAAPAGDYPLDPYYTQNNGPALEDRPPPPMDDRFIARGGSPLRGASPGPGIGQAIEMDERTGSPPGNYYQQTSYDAPQSAQSMGSMQRMHSPDRADAGPMYSNEAYVPPRADWKPTGTNHPSRFSPENASSHYSSGRGPLSPIQASPRSPQDTMSGSHHTRAGSENYYEDVDPRFALDEPSIDQHMHNAPVPSALMPGTAYGGPARMQPPPQHDKQFLAPPNSRHHNSSLAAADRSNSNSSIDDHGQPDTRSPDGSEASHFTSISQRPVNPHWRPGYSGGGSGSSAVAAQRRREDVILNGNPDFSLPGMSGRGRGRGGSVSNITTGLTPQGRYPTEI